MDIVDVFNVLIVWAHLISSTAWVGGSIFWLIVLTPSIKKIPANHKTEILKSISNEFKSVVDTSMFILLFTGAIMTFNRITPGHIGSSYVLILGIKILLVSYLFYLLRSRRRNYPNNQSVPTEKGSDSKITIITKKSNLIVLIGLIIYLISNILRSIYDASIHLNL